MFWDANPFYSKVLWTFSIHKSVWNACDLTGYMCKLLNTCVFLSHHLKWTSLSIPSQSTLSVTPLSPAHTTNVTFLMQEGLKESDGYGKMWVWGGRGLCTALSTETMGRVNMLTSGFCSSLFPRHAETSFAVPAFSERC